jgi:hypothetical protein
MEMFEEDWAERSKAEQELGAWGELTALGGIGGVELHELNEI